MRPILAWTLTALLVGFSAPCNAQSSNVGLFAYGLTLESGQVNVKFDSGGGLGFINGTFRDLSLKGDLYPAGTPVVPVILSSVNLRATGESDPGWIPGTPNPFSFATTPGTATDFQVPIILGAGVTSPYYRVTLNATVTDPQGGTHYLTANILAVTSGVPNFNVQPLGPFPNKLAPREVFVTHVALRNLDFQPHSYEFTVAGNPCGMPVAVPGIVTVGGREGPDGGRQDLAISMRGPEQSLFYLFGDNCQLTITVAPSGQPGRIQTLVFSPQVIGSNITFPVIFWTLAILLLLLLLILVLRNRKQAIEEEILGKPQKPWTIPVERVYLKALRQKDHRAWYVVRHYLMEDEYRSALLWHHAYKKATRQSRRSGREILAMERAYKRWRRREERKLARPMAKADAYEAQLQRKLDRKARRAHRKELRAHAKAEGKIKAAYERRVAKAAEAHAKAVRKAERKGTPAPDAPSVAAPDLPPAPQLQPVPLAGHRFGKRAARYRARMLRRTGDLEVRFERADAARRSRLDRQLAKAARGLDDAEFAAEHGIAGAPASRAGRRGA